eukprot:2115805-Alexandrium_andersonii.AAC.1
MKGGRSATTDFSVGKPGLKNWLNLQRCPNDNEPSLRAKHIGCAIARGCTRAHVRPQTVIHARTVTLHAARVRAR